MNRSSLLVAGAAAGALVLVPACGATSNGSSSGAGATAGMSGGSGTGASGGVGGAGGVGGSSGTGGVSGAGGAGGSAGAIGAAGASGSAGAGGVGGTGGSGGTSGAGGTGGTGGSSGTGGTGGSGGATSGIRIIVEPDGKKGQELVDAINAAKSSVHMTMYLLSSNGVINALISRHNAGLDVRVVLDKNLPTGSSNAAVYTQLQQAGVGVHWAPAQFTYTHEKCVILDKKEAWIMTMNATYSSPIDNREYLAVDDNAADVAEAETVFAGDYANNPVTSVTGPLVVAPINAVSKLVALMNSATQRIDIEAEELSDYHTANALSAAAKAGVQVRVVLSNATASASQTTAIAQIKAAGAQIVVLATPFVHAKSLVVDAKTAYVGSENFSTGSLQYNRELGVIFSTASEVQKVLSTTQADFAAGTPQ